MRARFLLPCHWEGGGPLTRTEEVVHIFFAYVLLLSAPDCLNRDNCQWNFVFLQNIQSLEGKYSTNEL